MASYGPIKYDPFTGKIVGIIRQDDNATIPKNPDNSDWQAFLYWNSIQSTPLDLTDSVPPVSRRPRDPDTIALALRSLTTAQKTAIWSDLISGSPIKILRLSNERKPILEFIKARITSGVLPISEIVEHKLLAIVCFVLDNPNYLVFPTFDLSVMGLNIPGDEPAS